MAVCTPAGSDLLCFCEKGYQWPEERCLHSLTCQEHDSALPGGYCSCLKGLPPQGPFCQLPEGMQLFFFFFFTDLLNEFSILPQANVCLVCIQMPVRYLHFPVFFSIHYLKNQSQTEHRISRRPKEHVLCPL